MGITRRLFDLARSNLTSLIDPNPARGDGSLGDFTDDELKAELDTKKVWSMWDREAFYDFVQAVPADVAAEMMRRDREARS